MSLYWAICAQPPKRYKVRFSGLAIAQSLLFDVQRHGLKAMQEQFRGSKCENLADVSSFLHENLCRFPIRPFRGLGTNSHVPAIDAKGFVERRKHRDEIARSCHGCKSCGDAPCKPAIDHSF